MISLHVMGKKRAIGVISLADFAGIKVAGSEFLHHPVFP